jgi:predicted lactoylglutathione lyase
MIGYVTFGTNDLARAGAFYDSLLAEFGATRFLDDGRMIVWGTTPDQPMFGACTPYDENASSVGNGAMVALKADSKEMVRKVYDKAIELGATDEGEPGPRGDGPFYGGYFRDLDGNKFVTFFMGM